jgi:hypothetical protein
MTSEDYAYLRELAEQFILDTFGENSRPRNEHTELLTEFLEYAESIERTAEPLERQILFHRPRF